MRYNNIKKMSYLCWQFMTKFSPFSRIAETKSVLTSAAWPSVVQNYTRPANIPFKHSGIFEVHSYSQYQHIPLADVPSHPDPTTPPHRWFNVGGIIKRHDCVCRIVSLWDTIFHYTDKETINKNCGRSPQI